MQRVRSFTKDSFPVAQFDFIEKTFVALRLVRRV